MSGVNAQIPLSFRPAPVGPNFGAAISDASNLMQLQQAGQEEHRQNQLRGILGAPGALDDMGQPKPETMTKVMGVDPNAGMKLQQNFLATQQKKLQMDALKSKTSYEQADMLNNAYSPIGMQYKENLSKMPAAQALKIAQDATTETTERLRNGGGLTPEAAQRLPTQFDPMKFEQMGLQTDMYLKWHREQNQERREKQTEKHQTTQEEIERERLAAAQKAGQWLPGLGKDDTGNNVPGMWFTPKEGGEPVFHPGVMTTPKGGTSAANQDRDAQVNVVRSDYEKELGRPVNLTDPNEKAELDRRVLAAEDKRKAGQAGAATAERERAKQEAGEKMGVPETPEQRQATAAQLATGQPMTQVIPGWGKEAGKAREQARQDAIQLIRDQTGMTAAEAGVELANRGIEYASGKKSSGQLTTMLGATRQGVMQLDFNIDKTKQEMKKLGSTDLSPILNAIARGEERWTGNPAYTSLFYYMNATAMESARILSGGQASIQQLHEGARKEAERWMNINMTPASFDAVAKAIKDEGHYRVSTFEKAIEEQRIGGKKPAAAAEPVAPSIGAKATEEQTKLLPVLTSPDDVERLAPGSFFITPRGIIGQSPKGAGTKPPTEAKPPAAAKPAEPKPETEKPAAKAAANPNDLPDGSIVSQGGTRYRKQGGNWVAIE